MATKAETNGADRAVEVKQPTMGEVLKEMSAKSEGDRMLRPTNWHEAYVLAQALAKSTMVPTEYVGQPENVLLAFMQAATLGLSVFAIMQNTANVHGKRTIYGSVALGLWANHPGYQSREESLEHIEGEGWVAKCVVKTTRGETFTGVFSEADAQNAGLLNRPTKYYPDGDPRDVWQAYRKDMLMWKARARALRPACPGALDGMGLYEDMIGGEEKEVEELVVQKEEASTEKGAGGFASRHLAKEAAQPAEATDPEGDAPDAEAAKAVKNGPVSKSSAKETKSTRSSTKSKKKESGIVVTDVKSEKLTTTDPEWDVEAQQLGFEDDAERTRVMNEVRIFAGHLSDEAKDQLAIDAGYEFGYEPASMSKEIAIEFLALANEVVTDKERKDERPAQKPDDAKSAPSPKDDDDF